MEIMLNSNYLNIIILSNIFKLMNKKEQALNEQLSRIKIDITRKSSIVDNLLSSDDISNNFNKNHSYRNRKYPPIKALSMFVSQSLSNGKKSCTDIVSEYVAEEAANGNTLSSLSGGYVQARKKLLTEEMMKVLKKIASYANNINTDSFHGMNVKVVDGTTIRIPDSEANKTIYPYSSNQKEGCSNLLVRAVVIMSFSTGSILDFAVAPYKGKGTGEHSLLREIFDENIDNDTLLLGDCYYPSYWLLSALILKSANGVFKLSESTKSYKVIDGKNKKDCKIIFKKPIKPNWMEQAYYEVIPNTITLRMIKANKIKYVTTLLDKKYKKLEIKSLYNDRWSIELNIRSLKTFMGMESLVCKSPDMIEREILSYFIAYNIVRLMMTKSAIIHGKINSNFLSFLHAMNLVVSLSMPLLYSNGCRYQIWDKLLKEISKKKVANRSGRYEPRVTKKTGASFPKMNKKRSEYKIDKIA